MEPDTLDSARLHDRSQIVWEDGERVFRRGWRQSDNGQQHSVLIVQPADEFAPRAVLDRLAHEYQFKDQLQAEWAVRPLALTSDAGRTMLILEDAGGEPLTRLLGPPMEIDRFLDVAVAIATTVRKLHERGLIHKDIKPAHILVTAATGEQG